MTFSFALPSSLLKVPNLSWRLPADQEVNDFGCQKKPHPVLQFTKTKLGRSEQPYVVGMQLSREGWVMHKAAKTKQGARDVSLAPSSVTARRRTKRPL